MICAEKRVCVYTFRLVCSESGKGAFARGDRTSRVCRRSEIKSVFERNHFVYSVPPGPDNIHNRLGPGPFVPG